MSPFSGIMVNLFSLSFVLLVLALEPLEIDFLAL